MVELDRKYSPDEIRINALIVFVAPESPHLDLSVPNLEDESLQRLKEALANLSIDAQEPAIDEPIDFESEEAMASATEAVLVTNATSGDKAAFSALYDQHYNQVYRYLLYRLSSPEDAEDLTQLTFLQSWRAIGRYQQGESPFVAWLFTIAHNFVISHYRRNRPVLSLEDGNAWDHANEESDPSRVLLGEVFDKERIRVAISQLKSDYQRVIVLRFLENLPHGEIAILMGKTEIAIRVIQHRAIAKLREFLSVEGRISLNVPPEIEQEKSIVIMRREIRATGKTAQIIELISARRSETRAIAEDSLVKMVFRSEFKSRKLNLVEARKEFNKYLTSVKGVLAARGILVKHIDQDKEGALKIGYYLEKDPNWSSPAKEKRPKSAEKVVVGVRKERTLKARVERPVPVPVFSPAETEQLGRNWPLRRIENVITVVGAVKKTDFHGRTRDSDIAQIMKVDAGIQGTTFTADPALVEPREYRDALVRIRNHMNSKKIKSLGKIAEKLKTVKANAGR